MYNFIQFVNSCFQVILNYFTVTTVLYYSYAFLWPLGGTVEFQFIEVLNPS